MPQRDRPDEQHHQQGHDAEDDHLKPEGQSEQGCEQSHQRTGGHHDEEQVQRHHFDDGQDQKHDQPGDPAVGDNPFDHQHSLMFGAAAVSSTCMVQAGIHRELLLPLIPPSCPTAGGNGVNFATCVWYWAYRGQVVTRRASPEDQGTGWIGWCGAKNRALPRIPERAMQTVLTSNRLSLRTLRLFAGLFAYGIAIALMIRANLGSAPWDVLSQGIARATGMSFGWATVAISAAVLLLWIPLRQKPGAGTIANALLVGFFADIGLLVIPLWH